VKVIIIGQDPYPKAGMANGISFGTEAHHPTQKSLKNIYEEIKRNYPEWPVPHNGNLNKWVTQGVFLLNASLTRDPSIADASPTQHFKKKLWMPFIIEVMSYIKRVNPNVLFVVWGANARQALKACQFKKMNNDNVFDCQHPSPMNSTPNPNSFKGCNHFVLINNRLIDLDVYPIEW
jgi:uracil-DNA glycosylase